MTVRSAREAVPAADFRRVMSHFATGVVIVTGTSESGDPLGMTCQSFVSLSLDPPLVSISPALSSTTWPAIESTGFFAVNVLAQEQRPLSGVFARSGGDKFVGVDWFAGRLGLPLLRGALAQVECRIDALHPAGDHRIVVGRVVSLSEGERPGAPLIFHRSDYANLQGPQHP